MNSSQFNVSDTQKQASNAYEHFGILDSGCLKVGDNVNALIDIERRKSIMRNHSATHLLHESLRLIVGDQVNQKGSLVESDKLRFDFSHDEAVSKSNLDEVEALVNKQILGNSKVNTEETDIESAKRKRCYGTFW